jgi:exonuclease III
LANWIKKGNPTICCLQETPSHWQKKTLAYSERLEEDSPSQWPPKTEGVAILISYKIDFKLTFIRWDKEGDFILIKGKIYEKEITIINLYASKVSAPNFIKHTPKDWKAHIDSNRVVVGDFNTLLPPSSIDRSSKQKINKEILEQNHTIDKMDITDV